ncbi:hypothetical protein K227x_34430 [Rubripirellula lacrimiformis]|uniref:Uncharacterized protein n=1 Tax=Rubripirellula lacrimiformis TaxID=1930273 RepID=A0A517ND31_9BACT|nr:hypothetical protein [Rubripirellula lacrimiformis]QDT05045.1 hypothetical protein K227x_34430 [Rubripirellula lacrimiformis]
MGHSDPVDGTEPLPIVVVVFEHDASRLGAAVEYDAALTLWATMSEDPANWDEVAGYWPRYRCLPGPDAVLFNSGVCEFLDGLPIQPCDRDQAIAAIEGHGNWFAIDLVQKRIVTGSDMQPLGRQATLALATDEKGKQRCPLPFALPDWWELHEAAEASLVSLPRETEIQIPRCDREVLFGLPMISDLASRILKVVGAGRMPVENNTGRGPSVAMNAVTVEVHRDWLMTPRSDLDGQRPRDSMHGAHDWSDSIVEGQRMRFSDGAPMIAAPDDVLGYADAPMGREEMIVYFDLCREIIDAGWQWCQERLDASDDSKVDASGDWLDPLVTYLIEVRDSWMHHPFEGDAPPEFIIECSRRRVPRGDDIPIVGMEGPEVEQHMPDCDCPICDIMASGMFGPGFTILDGHQLELDDEFAFSTHQFIEDWEQEQEELREFRDSFGDEPFGSGNSMEAGESEDDIFASAWSNPMSDDPLPGDPQGHLKLSFRLAEIIGDLENAGAERGTIRSLNNAFRNYRESDRADVSAARTDLARQLDHIAEQYPSLLPKIADFQSQVDELQRESAEVQGEKESRDNDSSR